MSRSRRTTPWPDMRKHICILCLLLAFLPCMPAFAERYTDYNSKDIGVVIGSVQEEYVTRLLPNSRIQYYDSFSDLAVALRQGKISAFIMSLASSRLLLDANPMRTLLKDKTPKIASSL